MKARTYYLLTGVLFTAVALVHLSRVLIGWEVTVGDWNIAQSWSVLGFLITGYLAYTAFKLHHHSHSTKLT